MFAAFRRLSKSTVGTIIMVLFLVAIIASFALADMSNVGGSLRGGSQGQLAKVGSERVTDRDLDSLMERVLREAQAQNPEATYATIAGQVDAVMSSLIDERALIAFSEDHGFVLSKRLIDAQIANLPQTRGLDGKFSEQAYQLFLQQQRMTNEEVRQTLKAALTQRLLLAPAALDARIPMGVASPYASMLLEQRQGQMALVPAEAFRAGLNPSDGDLQSFYGQNRQRYLVPEQRVLRYALIGPEAVAGVAPTEAEIAAHYKANQASYGGTETRVLSQAIVQSKAEADGIAARAKGGAAFAAAAAPAGFAAEDVSLGALSRADFVSRANEAVANAAFSAAKGAVIGPVRSDLGWHVIKVEDVRGAAGRSLAQARDEIAAQLTVAKRKEALADLINRVEEQIMDGASFSEAVEAAKLAVATTPAVNSGGVSRADPAYRLPPALQPALKAAFAMEAGAEPEVVSLPGEAGYALVGVEQIVESAPAPLAEIKDRVREDWIQRKSNDRARAVATEIAGKVARGMPIEQATAQAGVTLPPVQPVTARRLQISQANADAVAPLRLLFSLPQGGSRMGGDPRGRGFFIVKNNRVTPGNAMNSPLLIAQTRTEFQQSAPTELSQQMLAAMKADQGVERNEEAIAAAKRRYSGAGQ